MKQQCRIPSGVPVIYEIVNKKTGKRYIGSTTRYRMRFCEHRRMLESREHHSRHLQRSYSKHGGNPFVMRPLEIVCIKSLLTEREQWWMDKSPSRSLYNQSLIAGRAISKIRKVWSIDPETGEKKEYESSSRAAEVIHGTVDRSNLITKAIRRFKKSGGLFWTYKKSETLSSVREKRSRAKLAAMSKRPDCVFAFDKDNNIVGSFKTIRQAAKHYGVRESQVYRAIHSPRYRTAAGLTWSDLQIPRPFKCTRTKSVLQIKDNRVIKRWESCVEAANSVYGVNHKGISSAATGYTKTHGGYRWVFAKT